MDKIYLAPTAQPDSRIGRSIDMVTIERVDSQWQAVIIHKSLPARLLGDAGDYPSVKAMAERFCTLYDCFLFG